MDRRTLTGLMAGVGTAALAGCLGALSEATGSEDRGDASERHEQSAERVTIGDGDGETEGVDVIVRNAAPEEREVDVSIRHDGEPVLERTETLPPEDVLGVTLQDAGTYEVAVDTAVGRSATAVTQPTDCEDARTEITVSEYGLETTTVSTC